MPSQTCVMDRTGYTLDSACAFATGGGAGDAGAAEAAIVELDAGG